MPSAETSTTWPVAIDSFAASPIATLASPSA
jgi:hypothetical protein